MTDPEWQVPPMYGPPPPEPKKPEPPRTNHILHLLLTVVTFGLWIVLWAVIAANNHANYRAEVKRYDEEHEAWVKSYVRWQYGSQPPPQSGRPTYP